MSINDLPGNIQSNYFLKNEPTFSYDLKNTYKFLDFNWHKRTDIFCNWPNSWIYFFFIVGRSVDETIRLVKAFQFVEKHGEVCPANWSENSPTIKPNPEGSLEYFEKVNE